MNFGDDDDFQIHIFRLFKKFDLKYAIDRLGDGWTLEGDGWTFCSSRELLFGSRGPNFLVWFPWVPGMNSMAHIYTWREALMDITYKKWIKIQHASKNKMACKQIFSFKFIWGLGKWLNI